MNEFNNLSKLNKSELINLIYDYWVKLKKQAENDLNNSENENLYGNVIGRTKMTQVNLLKNLITMKTKKYKETPSFWFLTDMHTFIKPKGDNIREIKESMKNIAKEHPYGMVCSVIVVDKNGNDLRRVGDNYHVNENGWVNIEQWYNEIIKDPVIKNYGKKISKKNDDIFLIEKIWMDVLENDVNSALGYKPVGYIETEEKAKEFCKNGKTYTFDDCWAIDTEEPEFKYKKIKKL